MPRAFLRLGGATLAQHQLMVALAAGCERIACIARALTPEMVALQHEAERAGARFHMISGARALSGLVTANDELLVMGDGVVVAVPDALDSLGGTPAILVLPAESAVPQGFERIDLNHAAAGLMLLPGRLVERLNDLPADAEPVSALLRIGLQAGIAQRGVPALAISAGRWLLVRDEDAAHSAELEWMERHTIGRGSTPGLALATLVVRSFGPALLHGGSGGKALALAAYVLIAIAAGAGWFGWSAIALGLCAPAWLLHRSASIIDQIQIDALGRRPGLLASELPFSWLFDAVIAALLILATPYIPGEGLWQRMFAPLMLFGLLSLFSGVLPGRWTAWLADRMLLALLLCALALASLLGPGVPALAALLLLGAVYIAHRSGKPVEITRA
ncbi:MAG: hypothetical protein ABIU18_04390 [Novosphingobium sp.]